MKPGRILAVAALVLVLAGCSTGSAAPVGTASTSRVQTGPASPSASSPPAPASPSGAGTPRVSVPVPAGVDRSSPDAVGAAFITAAWTMDTRTDPGPGTAGARALALAAPALAAKLAITMPQTTSSDWVTWSAHHAWTTVQLVPDNDTRPDDTPGTAYRAWSVTVTPQAPGWTGTPWHLTGFVTMTKTAGSWAVSDLRVS
ncbi:MAG TPA: hypothetical protein VFP72_03935 [Kineosporiaceae bacterium]|nr:hypothetical protein [Kineosporiaceae bacterium]